MRWHRGEPLNTWREVRGISLFTATLLMLLATCLMRPAPCQQGRRTHLQLASLLPHRGRLLSYLSMKDCHLTPTDFLDHAGNHVALSGDGNRRCGYAIGAGAEDEYGKLILPRFAATEDIWMSGYVYFSNDFSLPQSVEDGSTRCNMGVHLWRLYSNLGQSRVSMDFNIPAGTDHVQLFMFFTSERETLGKPAREIAKNLKFRPAESSRKGRWQFWELHLNLGHPGKSEGYLRFYADGELVDGLEGEAFLPKGATRDWWIHYADVQSNISGGECGGRLWPAQNQWLTDGITLCRGMRCRNGRKWKGP